MDLTEPSVMEEERERDGEEGAPCSAARRWTPDLWVGARVLAEGVGWV